MIFISHRGNVDKINVKEENKPTYILNALNKNFDVEVDIWFIENKFYLGHDTPTYKVDMKFINTKRIWFHAKNIEAFYELLKLNIVCFWHENDDVTLTSNGYIWTYPGKQLTSNSICVLPEVNNIKIFNCAGICSDFIINYAKAQN
tara:strand:+ start:135 stop:572 length:438 start_codon:yes stop_codon:yes gene_type:complete